MKSITSRPRKQKRKLDRSKEILSREAFEALELNSRIAAIQQLIPLGMMVVQEELMRDVERLAGPRYSRRDESAPGRYGYNPGSVKLAGSRIAVNVPRVRGPFGEIPLPSYERLHRGGELDEKLFRRVLSGISCRDYESAASDVPGALGLSKSTVSAQFVEASAAKLKEFQERDLRALDVVAIFMDGKSFAEDQMVTALGVTMAGEKKFLGFVQTDTENSRVLTVFLNDLLARGLNIDKGLLVVIDGGKGLRSAVREAFGKHALVQRCQWHKRENILSHLSKEEQPLMRRRLQKAYQRPGYKEALTELNAIRKDLEKRNISAMRSLEEGLEETLTLHRLGVFALLSVSLKTTNCIESVNAHAEQRCGKVDRWRNSSQKHRWFAAALLDMEPRLRKIRGYKHLPVLREAIMKELNLTETKQAKKAS